MISIRYRVHTTMQKLKPVLQVLLLLLLAGLTYLVFKPESSKEVFSIGDYEKVHFYFYNDGIAYAIVEKEDTTLAVTTNDKDEVLTNTPVSSVTSTTEYYTPVTITESNVSPSLEEYLAEYGKDTYIPDTYNSSDAFYRAFDWCHTYGYKLVRYYTYNGLSDVVYALGDRVIRVINKESLTKVFILRGVDYKIIEFEIDDSLLKFFDFETI